MQPGTRVEVRSRFDRRWSRGFEVAEEVATAGERATAGVVDASVPPPRYLVRRRSDGSVLPAEFDAEEVRAEKRGRTMWWV